MTIFIAETLMTLQPEAIIQLTREYGGEWAIRHSERILHLISVLGEGMEYDREAVWLAAYLHDWGGYPKWIVEGMDHAARSREVAEGFLQEHHYPEPLRKTVLECIAFHHGGQSSRSLESRLFTDADALDLLGVVGTLRVFSMHHRDLRAAWNAVHRWRETCVRAIELEPSKALARVRLEETDRLLQTFEEETFGLF